MADAVLEARVDALAGSIRGELTNEARLLDQVLPSFQRDDPGFPGAPAPWKTSWFPSWLYGSDNFRNMMDGYVQNFNLGGPPLIGFTTRSFLPMELIWAYWQDAAGLYELYDRVVQDATRLGSIRLRPREYRDLQALDTLRRMGLLPGPKSRNSGYARRYGLSCCQRQSPPTGTLVNYEFEPNLHAFVREANRYYLEKRVAGVIQAVAGGVIAFDPATFIQAGRSLLDALEDHSYGNLEDLTVSARVLGLGAYRLMFDAQAALGISDALAGEARQVSVTHEQKVKILSKMRSRIVSGRESDARAYVTIAEENEFLLVMLRVLASIWSAPNVWEAFLKSNWVKESIERYIWAYQTIRGVQIPHVQVQLAPTAPAMRAIRR